MELIASAGIMIRGKDGSGKQRIQPKGVPFEVTDEYGQELLDAGIGVKKYKKPGPKKAEPKPEPKPKAEPKPKE